MDALGIPTIGTGKKLQQILHFPREIHKVVDGGELRHEKPLRAIQVCLSRIKLGVRNPATLTLSNGCANLTGIQFIV